LRLLNFADAFAHPLLLSCKELPSTLSRILYSF